MTLKICRPIHCASRSRPSLDHCGENGRNEF
jgi:hypothetical protein